MQMIHNPAAVWICVIFGLAVHALVMNELLRDAQESGHRRAAAVLPALLGLVCAKVGYLLLQGAGTPSAFRWCFTTGIVGMLLGTGLAARMTGMDTIRVQDRAAPALCAAAALARLSQRWLGEVGAGPWLEEGSFFCRAPFALVNDWGEAVLAIYLPEALAALIGSVLCLRRESAAGRKGIPSEPPGGSIAVAAAFLTVPQILLEQLRSGHFMHWRMMRAEQAVCALTALAVLLYVFVKREGGFRAGLRSAAGPAAAFLGCCILIAVTQFVLDGKLFFLPVPVCWTVYVLADLIMLWITMIPARGSRETEGKARV